MLGELQRLRDELGRRSPGTAAANIGGECNAERVRIDYWARAVVIDWSDLQPRSPDGTPLSAFDSAVILHHMNASDGSPAEGRWIAYRDLPGGEFYHQAYLGYTGRRLALAFGSDPAAFDAAASTLGGERLDSPAPHTWAFAPLPRIPLAACLWPGDDELPAQASVVFDAGAARHMPIDGLALLGAGLTGRLLRSGESSPR